MALKPVITIDVNSEQFKAFQTEFERYADAVTETNSHWRDLKTLIPQAAAPIEREANRITASIQRMNVALHSTAKGFGHVATAAGKVEHIVGRTIGLLGKFSLIGSIAGGIGLFGLDMLARNAFGRAKSAAGVSMTPGQLSSLSLNASRFLSSPSGFATAVANLQNNPTLLGYLPAVGIGVGQATGESTFSLSRQLLRSAFSTAHSFGNGPINQFDPRVWSLLQMGVVSLQDLRMMQQMSPQQFQRAMGRMGGDVGALGFSKQVANDWSQLDIQLRRAGLQIETVFIKDLHRLAPDLNKLSAALVDVINSFMSGPGMKKLIDDMAAGLAKVPKYIDEFASYVGSKKFQDKIIGFVSDVEKAGREFGAIIDGVYNFAVRLGLIDKAVTYKQLSQSYQPSQTNKGASSGFLNRGIETAAFATERGLGQLSPTNIEAQAKKYATKYGVPLALVNRILLRESSFGQGGLISSAGALGPMQLMPDTAAALGVNPLSVSGNISGGTRDLSLLFQHFHDWRKTVAAYNWGPGNVDALVAKYGNGWERHLPPGVELYVRQTVGSLSSISDSAVAGLLRKDAARRKQEDQDFPHSFGTAPGDFPAPPAPAARRRSSYLSGPAQDTFWQSAGLAGPSSAGGKASPTSGGTSRLEWLLEQQTKVLRQLAAAASAGGNRIAIQNNTAGQVAVIANSAKY